MRQPLAAVALVQQAELGRPMIFRIAVEISYPAQ
jgi:hypothetical protein